MTDVKTYVINGHTVETYYAGFTNYVVDGNLLYSATDAAKACNMEAEDFHDRLHHRSINAKV